MGIVNQEHHHTPTKVEQAAIMFVYCANGHLIGTGVQLALDEEGCMVVIHTHTTTDEEAARIADLALLKVYQTIH